jgi:hypothetical protein
MENAVRVRVTIGPDHTVRLPDEIPTGEAELIVLFPAVAESDRTRRIEERRRMFGRLQGQATIADDFDAPLVHDFEGSHKLRDCSSTGTAGSG